MSPELRGEFYPEARESIVGRFFHLFVRIQSTITAKTPDNIGGGTAITMHNIGPLTTLAVGAAALMAGAVAVGIDSLRPSAQIE